MWLKKMVIAIDLSPPDTQQNHITSYSIRIIWLLYIFVTNTQILILSLNFYHVLPLPYKTKKLLAKNISKAQANKKMLILC
jgi:hypothetical protein